MQNILEFFKKHKDLILKGLLFLISIILLVIIFPKEGKFKYGYQKGRPWMHKDLIATFDFAILKPEGDVEIEKEQILKTIPPYFIYDQQLVDDKFDEMENWFESNWESKYHGQNILLKHKNFELIVNIFDSLTTYGILGNIPAFVSDNNHQELVVIKGKVAERLSFDQVFTVSSAYEFIKSSTAQNEGVDAAMVLATLENNLFRNLTYDKNKTEIVQEKALAAISLTRGMVQSGERIISKGGLVTAQKFNILESVRREYEEKLGLSASHNLIVLGQVILVTISIVVLFFFLLYFRKDIYLSNRKVLLILVAIILMVYITSLVIKYQIGYLYLVPICIIPILIRAFFDTRPALYVHIITIIIIGFLVPNSFEFVFSQLVAGIIAIISVVHLQRRAQFFITSAMIFLTYSFVYVGLSLVQEASFTGIEWTYFLLFAGSAVLTLFSYPLIYAFEKIFGLITDVTLIELSNTNTKLLRELSMKAPGTFQHSMQVANLAEEILYQIGGNNLLARTGALYHDIGKVATPAYFIENQSRGVNPHDKISTDESAKIIRNHITRGVRVAKKAGLPVQIIDFIRTHQGNRRIEYFYAMKKKEVPEEEIDQKIYTYPGPIPMSRETAVVMMSDSVEAASRSIKEPDVESINKLVENIIDKQIENKQFINSNITFQEITRIKEIIKKQLLNMYHVRIEYPE